MRGFQPAKGKAKTFANGGPVRGPGTGTSDEVADTVPNGTYIMPADSTQAVGEQQLAAMGGAPRGFAPANAAPQGDGVPVQLSNGEFKLPPEQVHAIGVQALDQMKNATHAPVAARGFAAGAVGAPQRPEPPLFFADGGLVDDENRRPNSFGDAAATVSTPGTTLVTTPATAPAGAPAPAPAAAPAAVPSAAPTPSNIFPGNRLQGDSGATAAPSPAITPAAATPAATAPPTATPVLDPQVRADRAAIGSAWDTVKDVSNDAGRAIADVASLVPRGLVGAYDSAVVRPMRAAGLDAAYLSPKLVPDGVDPSSMTPFTDQKRMQQAAAAIVAPGQQPLPTGVNPSTAGAGRGAVNPPLAAPSAPAVSTVGLPPAAAPAPAEPPANQVMPGVYRTGNSYGDSPEAARAGAQPRGLPSAQNMAAADAMAQRQVDSALQAPRGFAPGVPQFAAPQVSTSANDWETRNNLRNLEVSASSITNNGGRFDPRRGRNTGPSPAQAAYTDALRADLTARGLQPSLDNSTNQINAGLQREDMQQAGSNQRNAADNSARAAEFTNRGFVDRSRLALEQDRQATDSKVRGFEIRAGERQERLQQQYAAAKTPQEREAIAKQIRDLAGKPDQSPWRVQVTPSVKNVDGSTSEGSVIRYNDQTGAVEKVDLSAAANSAPKVTTQAQFDALPKGTKYVGEDGRTYQKPA